MGIICNWYPSSQTNPLLLVRLKRVEWSCCSFFLSISNNFEIIHFLIAMNDPNNQFISVIHRVERILFLIVIYCNVGVAFIHSLENYKVSLQVLTVHETIDYTPLICKFIVFCYWRRWGESHLQCTIEIAHKIFYRSILLLRECNMLPCSILILLYLKFPLPHGF
jgi:hypothetical protein